MEENTNVGEFDPIEDSVFTEENVLPIEEETPEVVVAPVISE